MRRKKKTLLLYFCLIFIFIFPQSIQGFCLTQEDPTKCIDVPNSYITMDLDKTRAAVGEIIDVKIRVENIETLSGFETCIKYNPAVLKLVTPETGLDFLQSSKPLPGTIINNSKFGPDLRCKFDFDNGNIWLAKAYTMCDYYKQSGVSESSGILAELGFKVISSDVAYTDIKFSSSEVIPNAANSVTIFNWDYGIVPSENFCVIQPSRIEIGGPAPTPAKSYITMELDKNNVSQGDIITAKVKVENIADFAGLQANIKYDPQLFKPVNSISGEEYKQDTTPEKGTILKQMLFTPYSTAQNDIKNGTINFSTLYTQLSKYKEEGVSESSGIVAVIAFKVIGTVNRETYIYFDKTETMPGSNLGTYVYDWNGDRIVSGYSVIEPSKISISGINVTLPSWSGDSFITLELDKNNVGLGDIIKASVKINNIKNFIGCQVNINFDPEVLQAVNPSTGVPYNNRTFPNKGNILCIEDYTTYKIASHDLENGLINFGMQYTDFENYKNSGAPEETGVVAVIGFRVISTEKLSTSIDFTDCPSMPGAKTGTLLFNWDGNVCDKYSVIQPDSINIIPYIPQPSAAVYKLSGYLNPDFEIAQSTSSAIKSGFKVEVAGTGFTALTDENGYFEINNLPFSLEGYTLKISKANYLTRTIRNVSVVKDVQLSTSDSPIGIWAGDIIISGLQDNVINIADIMEVARGFNTSVSDDKYSVNYDINMDNAVNITDILIVAKHFNRAESHYPEL
jgi:hypothetical protein